MSLLSENKPGSVIKAWWSQNLGERLQGRPSGAALALAARLRRGEMIEVLSERPVYELAVALGLRDAERIARIAQVLAHVRGDLPQTLARRLGAGDPPALSLARFQRLMRADGEGLTTGLIRALPFAGHACNVAALASDLFYWSDPVRTRWIFDYHGAAAPQDLKEISE